MKKVLYPIAMLVLIAIVFSCSDDTENSQLDAIEEANDESNFQDSISAQSIINRMYKIQENATFLFQVGTCINPSEPNKFYYVCKDTQEAALFYNTYCTNEPWEVTYESEGDSLVTKFDVIDRKSSFGDYGYTSLRIGDGNPIYATIEFSFNAIGDTHELLLVPQSYMPYNSEDEAFSSPYTIGDIYKDGNGEQWVCVKESAPDSFGYFVRLTDGDNKYWERWCASDHYKSAWFAVEKKGYTIACDTAWRAFASLIKYSQGKNALQAMKNKTNNVNMEATRKLWEALKGENTDNRVFQAGQASTSDKNYHWKCARYLYEVWIPFIHIKGNTYTIATSYSWHEFDTKGGHIQEKSLKSGQEMLQLSFKTSKFSNMAKLYPLQNPR